MCKHFYKELLVLGISVTMLEHVPKVFAIPICLLNSSNFACYLSDFQNSSDFSNSTFQNAHGQLSICNFSQQQLFEIL